MTSHQRHRSLPQLGFGHDSDSGTVPKLLTGWLVDWVEIRVYPCQSDRMPKACSAAGVWTQARPAELGAVDAVPSVDTGAGCVSTIQGLR